MVLPHGDVVVPEGVTDGPAGTLADMDERDLRDVGLCTEDVQRSVDIG